MNPWNSQTLLMLSFMRMPLGGGRACKRSDACQSPADSVQPCPGIGAQGALTAGESAKAPWACQDPGAPESGAHRKETAWGSLDGSSLG
jgi:hypothetical protein